MKRRTTLLLLMLFLLAEATAQNQLNVAPLFEKSKHGKTMFTASHIEGKHLKPYNLTLFRSITTSDYRIYDEIEQLVEKDGKETIDKESGYINGKLFYAFYQCNETILLEHFYHVGKDIVHPVIIKGFVKN